ncbi:MAG: hypothetical protein MZV70_70415 [Desulfobacterales bacterium]|nr:hypothetical protein [Desulfobacterales bacterium]
MRSSTAKLLVCALIIGTLCLPSALSAKARRGALVVLTKVDGAEVKGELVSVKPDSLLLFKSGDALTIPRGRVHSVTIMRRSRMASGALTGFTGRFSRCFLGPQYRLRSRRPPLGHGRRLRRSIRARHRHGGQPGRRSSPSSR